MTDQYPDKKSEKTRVLPDGWRWIRLGEVCTVKGGKRLPQGHNFSKIQTMYPYIRVVDFGNGSVRMDDLVYLTEETQRTIVRYIISVQDVYISIAGSIGIVGTIPTELDGANLTENAARLVISDMSLLQRDYLALYLRSPAGQTAIESRTNKVGQPKLALERIGTIEIPLPPLSEQKRIVAILNEQMEAIEKARKATEVQLEAAKALPAAYLRAVFNSPEAKKWPSKSIKELCERIDYGYTCSADFFLTEPRFLRITDIQEGKVNWEQVPGCKIDECTEKKATLDDGDIVFARTGGTVGKSFLIENPPRAVFASYLIRMRPKAEVSGQFLYSFFQSNNYWQQIRLNAKGGAQPNINATMLGAIQLPMPPITIQKKIVFELKDQLSSTERLNQSLKSRLAAINALPAALLRQAFSGEL